MTQDLPGCSGPRLLWVEDDPPDRLEYETMILTDDEGWEVVWAPSLDAAVERLCATPFHAILLDQEMPLRSELDPLDLWGACKLLYWLRGKDPGPSPPWPEEPPGWDDVRRRRSPSLANRDTPVAIVSVFHNEEVLAATKQASTQDVTILYFAKPFDINGLVAWLRKVGPGREDK